MKDCDGMVLTNAKVYHGRMHPPTNPTPSHTHLCSLLNSLQIAAQIMGIPISIPGLQLEGNDGGQSTNILCLMNMVTMDELKDDEEYESESVLV